MMRTLVFSILLAFSLNIFAEDREPTGPAEPDMSPLQVSQLFDQTNKLDKRIKLVDLVAKEEKISTCIDSYKEHQIKSWARIPQNDLYEFLHDPERMNARIYGKKDKAPDEVSYEEKIEALATLQCEAYYAIGVLK